MARTEEFPPQRPGLFHASPEPESYAWWYADGISHDGNFAFTLIAFIGSVFSPYYAWSRRRDPHNHCAINLALYGRNTGRWAMTERGRSDLSVTPHILSIGPSALSWDEQGLTATISEFGAPLPYRLKGRIRLRPRYVSAETYQIDAGLRHHWRPVAPSAEVEVEFEEPNVQWSGEGYLDTNHGPEPLEERFRRWDWSRLQTADQTTVVLYSTIEHDGAEQTLALKFGADGRVETFEPPPECRLPGSPVFRIQRATRADSGGQARLSRTLEDTPFYARSIIESRVLGPRAFGVHESFDGRRLKLLPVKLMLPFRMPRRPNWAGPSAV